MVNPTSLRRRGVLPAASLPVSLEGYELRFEMGGMANIAAAAGGRLHGVAHRVTLEVGCLSAGLSACAVCACVERLALQCLGSYGA